MCLNASGVTLNTDSIFDVQVKRLHEYKRQHLNALHILTEYLWLKDNPNAPFVPKDVYLRREGRARILFGQTDHQVHLHFARYD